MADFEDGQDFENQEEREEQIKADRFTSLMFGPRSDNNGQRSQHHSEPKQDSSIDYEALMTNIDTLVDSVRGLKPLFNKVYPFIEQLWKKK